MGTIQVRTTSKGQKKYRAIVRIKGCKPISKTFGNKTNAETWMKKKEVELGDGRYVNLDNSKNRTFGEMIDRYLVEVYPTLESGKKQGRKFQLLRWKKELGQYLLVNVTAQKIADVSNNSLLGEVTCRGTPRGPATVVRYLAALSHVYGIAVKRWGWFGENPVSKVDRPKEPRGRVRFLDDDEKERLLVACRESANRYLYPVVMLAMQTGMRRSEIFRLQWSDILWDNSKVLVNITKNKERRSVYILDATLSALRNLFDRRDLSSSKVFSEKKEAEPYPFNPAWKDALKKAEISDFKFHDLRHTAASYLAMSGATLHDIAEILGHKTYEMVKRYTHLLDSHTASVVGRMGEKFFVD